MSIVVKNEKQFESILGIRFLMLMLGITNIRDVVPFPMNSRAQDFLMGAPIETTEKQFRELHIKLRQQ